VALEHLQHRHNTQMAATQTPQNAIDSYADLDRIIGTVSELNLAPPVLISPPAHGSHYWVAKSDAQNRTLRVNLVIDGRTGVIIKRENFNDRHIIDRIIGTSVAAHEGQLFGWFNQLLGLITAGGLMLLCISAIVMWWRRRGSGVLGAPAVMQPPKLAWGLIVVISLLGIYLPLFAASLLALLLFEKFILDRLRGARAWLGL
jgi:uncharacterized iron-regulated membrane protein